MDFKETFSEFYSKVKNSIANGTFAKLTLAKTIGNTDLMNIYVRPIVDEDVLKLVDYDAINEFRKKSMNINTPDTRGLAENEDIYFQSAEAKNKDYQNIN